MVSIVYVTNTGSSKRYAEMLSEKTGYPCYALSDSDAAVGTDVVFISWVMAGAIQGISEARVKFGTLKAVVAVGMMKSDSQDASLKEKNDVSETFFSLAGAFDIKKLSGMYKMMMPGKNTGIHCHFLFQGIFPIQGSNPGFLHFRQSLYHLSHQGSPRPLINLKGSNLNG